ncbi:hypothetical protein ACFE04_008453 [Oxalis oulophora]
MGDLFASGRRRGGQADEDEESLKWAAIEKLPTYDRLRTSVFQSLSGPLVEENPHRGRKNRTVDVRNLDLTDRQKFIDRILKVAEEDNGKFLNKFRKRINRVGIELPTVEARFKHLTIEADCYAGTRALPSLPNVARNIGESALTMLGVIRHAERKKLTILNNISGIVKPTRMTLLLGPPSSGKTTLLLALAGKLDQNLLSELARREKDAGIFPDVDVDLFMKVTSKKDQEQYWKYNAKPYRYVSVSEFSDMFKHYHVGMRLENELSVPYDKSRSHRAALVFKSFSVPNMELFRASWDKEWVLIKRNSIVYVIKTLQIFMNGFVTATLFIRTRMNVETENDGEVYVGAMLFAILSNTFNGAAELSIIVKRLPVFYKQRDLLFHPAWTFTLPIFLMQLPVSLLESAVWMAITYYPIGYAPEASRFFKQFILVFLVQQTAASMFRLIAGLCRSMIIANTGGTLTLMLVFLLGGFILPKGQIPSWWQWSYWISPLTYGYNAIVVNEMFAPRWMDKKASDNVTSLGVQVLKNFGVFANRNWYWIGTGVLVGFVILFNVLFTLSLMYLNPTGKPQAIISDEDSMEPSQLKSSMLV